MMRTRPARLTGNPEGQDTINGGAGRNTDVGSASGHVTCQQPMISIDDKVTLR